MAILRQGATLFFNEKVEFSMPTSVKPVAGDDNYAFDADQVISGNMLSNDMAGANGQLYLRDFGGQDVLGKQASQVTNIAGTYGTFHLMPDGSFTYTLNDAVKAGLYAGTTLHESVQYKVSDGKGHTDVAIFNLDINGTATRPHAVDDHYTFNENDAISGNVLDNDIPNETGQLYLRSVTGTDIGAKHGAGEVTDVSGQYGTFHFHSDGSFTYDLDPGVAAGLNTGQMVEEKLQYYKISDGKGHTDVGVITLDINGVTDKPTAVDDNFTFGENDTIMGNVLANDIPGGNGQLYLRSVTGTDIAAKQGPDQITDVHGSYGTFHFQSDGDFTYDLDAGVADSLHSGDSVTETLQYYKISDGKGNTDVGVIHVTINGEDMSALTGENLVSHSDLHV